LKKRRRVDLVKKIIFGKFGNPLIWTIRYTWEADKKRCRCLASPRRRQNYKHSKKLFSNNILIATF
jgi:hypothetical protein